MTTDNEAPWKRTDTDRLAFLRTTLAAERTVFAVMRTGLAIAAGGAVIITLLGDRWPEWLQAMLAAGFVVPGYALMLDGLGRYRRVARLTKEADPDRERMVSPRLVTALIIVVQVVVIAVVVLLVFDVFES